MNSIEEWKETLKNLELPFSWGKPSTDLPRIEEKINDKMKTVVTPREFPDLGFWYYNKHDMEHIKKVIFYLWQILKKRDIRLRPHEQYLLYLAAYGHDLGMTIWDESLKKAYERILGEKMNTSLMQKAHAIAGANIMKELVEPYIQNTEVRGVISEIIAYHSGDIEDEDISRLERREIDEKEIRTGLLIALLRIADTMDANEKRLPDEEIIATSLALTSTCKPFYAQCEHYMRRKIVESCNCEKDGIVLRVDVGFQNFFVKSPKGRKGKSVTFRGEDAFLGVLEEFGKELGAPENLEELKERFQDLDWNKLKDVWGKKFSNKLLEQYRKEIPWKVKFSGHPKQAIKVDWELKAKDKRERFDIDPHPTERISNSRGLIRFHYIKFLMPIEEALASQDIESDPFKPGQLFWKDVEKLLRRDEIDTILNCFKKDNIVLLEGYPASGKSSIACRLGYELVKENKNVYYGNLTTNIGLKCKPDELPKKLLEETEEIEQEIYLIIEDIHHAPKEFERLNALTKKKNIKILLTSRPLRQYLYDKETHAKAISQYFQWISSQNRITLRTDESVVKKILEKAEVSFSNLDDILNTIKRDEPNLLLLSFLVQASKKTKKPVDKIKIDEVRELVEYHLNKLKDHVHSFTGEFRKLELVKILKDILKLIEDRSKLPLMKEASLNLGYLIPLWPLKYQISKLEPDEGIKFLLFSNSEIIESLGILNLQNLQEDFPSELPSKSQFSFPEAVNLGLKYSALIRSELVKKREELVKWYDYGCTFGTIILGIMVSASFNLSQQEIQWSKEGLSNLSRILVKQGKELSLKDDLIKKAQELQQDIKNNFSLERAGYFFSQYMELFYEVKNSLTLKT